MSHIKGNQYLYLAGVALVLAGLLFAILVLVPSVQSGTVATTLYVATAPLDAGAAVLPADVKTTTLNLPPGFGDSYLSPSNFAAYSAEDLTVGINNGGLIPVSTLRPALSAKESGVAVSFKTSPTLAVGDVVDIFILITPTTTSHGAAAANSGNAVQTVLRNVTIEAPAASGWLITVPTTIASAVIFASNNNTLDASLVLVGNKTASPPTVNSLSQALTIIERSGAS